MRIYNLYIIYFIVIIKKKKKKRKEKQKEQSQLLPKAWGGGVHRCALTYPGNGTKHSPPPACPGGLRWSGSVPASFHVGGPSGGNIVAQEDSSAGNTSSRPPGEPAGPSAPCWQHPALLSQEVPEATCSRKPPPQL